MIMCITCLFGFVNSGECLFERFRWDNAPRTKGREILVSIISLTFHFPLHTLKIYGTIIPA